MKKYTEKSREISILHETDVLVVGGGPSGLAAAISASRSGADTTIVERYGSFGGTLTQVGVEGFAWYRHEGTVEAGGLTFEFEETAKKMGASRPEPQSISEALDAHLFKVVADKLILDAGVTPLLHCWAVDAIVANNVIKGIIVESKSGRQAILAKRVIDCTGDADIVALAGAPFRKQDKNKLMHVTPLFNCMGVDTKKFRDWIYNDVKPTYKDWAGEAWGQTITDQSGANIDLFSPYIEKPFLEAYATGELERDPRASFGGTYSTMDDATGSVTQMNMVFMNGYDCTDVKDLTLAEMEGRKNVLKALEVLNNRVPGFEKAKLRDFSMTLGTRESRIIDGHYTINEKDVLNEGRFEDSIGIFPEFVDGLNYLFIPTTGRYFQIPYRCILPKKIENLLVAGRTIDADKVGHCSCRNMSCCVVTGQGAGVAASISIKNNEVVSKVNIKDVQQELEKQNVRIK